MIRRLLDWIFQREEELPPREPPLLFHVNPETWANPSPELLAAIQSDKPVVVYFEAGQYDATPIVSARNTRFIGKKGSYG